MSQVKLTKNELRLQEIKLKQLTKYLPTLQLKKALLQTEVNNAVSEIQMYERTYKEKKEEVLTFAPLLDSYSLDEFFDNLHIEETVVDYENIAGVEVPLFNKVLFAETQYSLYVTPIWWDNALKLLKELIIQKEKILVAKRKKESLQKELREVSIRVNLFEKILIPRTEQNIKKIKIFLGDQQLSAVAQAKVAKQKVLAKKMSKRNAI